MPKASLKALNQKRGQIFRKSKHLQNYHKHQDLRKASKVGNLTNGVLCVVPKMSFEQGDQMYRNKISTWCFLVQSGQPLQNLFG